MSRTNQNSENIAGLHDVDAAPLEDAHMQKSTAGPIGEFDKSEAFLSVEPFDDGLYWDLRPWFQLCLPPQPASKISGSGVGNSTTWVFSNRILDLYTG